MSRPTIPRAQLEVISKHFIQKMNLMVSSEHFDMTKRIYMEGRHIMNPKSSSLDTSSDDLVLPWGDSNPNRIRGGVGTVYDSMGEVEDLTELRIAYITEENLRLLNDKQLNHKLSTFDESKELVLFISVHLQGFGYVTMSSITEL